MKEINFKYIVEGDHPIFMRIDRRCLTIEEAENVKDGLEAINYEVRIKKLKGGKNEYIT